MNGWSGIRKRLKDDGMGAEIAASERLVNNVGLVDVEVRSAQIGVRMNLLFRQKMKNLDLPKEPAEVTVELEREPKQVILQRIDEDHCNPLKLWEEMGCPGDLNAKEVEDLKERSRMVEEEMQWGYEDGKVSFTVQLGVNDVYFIRMIQET